MKVIMKTPGRNGRKPFLAGETIDLDSQEAATLIARGLCVAATEEAPAKPKEEEAATGKRGRPKKDGE